jgi:hypothetical protein
VNVPGIRTPQDALDLRDALLYEAQQARKDPKAYISFAAEEETLRARVTTLPHQRVLCDFIMAHPRCVVMLPVAHTKTFMSAHLFAWLLGHDITTRSTVISATQLQSTKVLTMIKALIANNPRSRLVFPGLLPGKPWTDTSFNVQRPTGIRDPSCTALGFEGAILGSRLNLIMVDDLLTHENTSTPEQREKVFAWFDNSILTRLDPPMEGRPPARCIVTNTAWHQDDLLHRLKRNGWPTIRMEITGNIYVYNVTCGINCPPDCFLHTNWDSDDLRPARADSPPEECRLVAHDPDPLNVQTLWPGKFGRPVVAHLRASKLPRVFAQSYLCLPDSDDSALCKWSYIERSLSQGKGLPLPILPANIDRLLAARPGAKRAALSVAGGDSHRLKPGTPPDEMGLVFTGVDLAVKKGEHNDNTAMVTFRCQPDGRRLLLDIEYAQWSVDEILAKCMEKHRVYNSILCVENNNAQDYIRQMLLTKMPTIPVVGVQTTAKKWHPEYGVPQAFLEFANGAWIFPCDEYLRPAATLQKLIDECLSFTPGAHTGDILMALTMGREVAKRFGHLATAGGAMFQVDLSNIVMGATRR